MEEYGSLHEFTPLGMEKYRKVMRGKLEDSEIDPIDQKFATPVSGTESFAIKKFDTAKDMAKAVLTAFGSVDFYKMLDRDGIWAWLGFVLRDQISKHDRNGNRIVMEEWRWYPSDYGDFRRSATHMVRFPVFLYGSFGDDADHMICCNVDTSPKIRYQLIVRYDTMQPVFQKVARKLYFDDSTSAVKPSATGTGGGTAKRLAEVSKQLDVTYEFEDLGVDGLLNILPAEFDPFKT